MKKHTRGHTSALPRDASILKKVFLTKRSVIDIGLISIRLAPLSSSAITLRVRTRPGERATANSIWRKPMAMSISGLNKITRKMVLRGRAACKLARPYPNARLMVQLFRIQSATQPSNLQLPITILSVYHNMTRISRWEIPILRPRHGHSKTLTLL